MNPNKNQAGKEGMEELKKDLSTKELLRNPDVFADISNVHLFGGEEVIRPEDLEPLPQDMVYRKRKGKLETLMGDVRMRFKKEGIVIRPTEPVFSSNIGAELSMKVVSNRYLLKNDD